MRDVEGLEIVPLVFDLRPVDDSEAEPPHDVLELGDGLHQRMPTPTPRFGPRQTDIQAGRHPLGPRKPSLGLVKQRGHASLDLVEPLADNRLLLFRDLPENGLQLLEFAAPRAEKLDAGLLQLRLVRRGGDGGHGGLLELFDAGERVHDRPSINEGGGSLRKRHSVGNPKRQRGTSLSSRITIPSEFTPWLSLALRATTSNVREPRPNDTSPTTPALAGRAGPDRCRFPCRVSPDDQAVAATGDVACSRAIFTSSSNM